MSKHRYTGIPGSSRHSEVAAVTPNDAETNRNNLKHGRDIVIFHEKTISYSANGLVSELHQVRKNGDWLILGISWVMSTMSFPDGTGLLGMPISMFDGAVHGELIHFPRKTIISLGDWDESATTPAEVVAPTVPMCLDRFISDKPVVFAFHWLGMGVHGYSHPKKNTRMVVQDVKTNLILGEKIYFKGINMYWCKLASLLPGPTKITFYGVVAFHCVWCLLLPYIGTRKGAKVVKTNALSQILKSMVSRCWPSSDGSVLRVAMAQKCRLQRTQFRSVFPHLNPSTKKSQCEPYSFHQ